MILVVTHTSTKNRYDRLGRLVDEKGTVWVSHGIDLATDKMIVLPHEKMKNFSHECVYHGGEWYLK